jgi:hypothetical protein
MLEFSRSACAYAGARSAKAAKHGQLGQLCVKRRDRLSRLLLLRPLQQSTSSSVANNDHEFQLEEDHAFSVPKFRAILLTAAVSE